MDAGDTQCQGNIFMEGGDFAHFYTGPQFHFIPGHCRAPDHIADFAVHAKAFQRLLQAPDIDPHFLGIIRLGFHCLRQHTHGRILIDRLLLGLRVRLSLDLHGHLDRSLLGFAMGDLLLLHDLQYILRKYLF